MKLSRWLVTAVFVIVTALAVPVVTAQLPAPQDAIRRAGAVSAGSVASSDPQAVASGGRGIQLAVDAMRTLGATPFLYPTAAPFCSADTPLGLSPALAGALPGPWPRQTVLNLHAVQPGQTMFAFVPSGVAPDGANTTGMQVAWFNVDTGRGGFVPMGSMAEVVTNAIPADLPPIARPLAHGAATQLFDTVLPMGGVRAVPVTTGSGTVLAAVFGVVRNGQKSCFYFPTVGITTTPSGSL